MDNGKSEKNTTGWVAPVERQPNMHNVDHINQ